MKDIERYPLTPDDKQQLTDLLACGVDTKDKRGHVLTVLKKLRAEESFGGESATRILNAMACTGLYAALNRHAARDTGVFMHSETGRVLNVPQRGSIRVAAGNGAPTGARQLKLWKVMSIPEFQEWSTSQLHLADSFNFKAIGIHIVRRAIEQFPEAQTAGDACRLAGIDPDALELDRAA